MDWTTILTPAIPALCGLGLGVLRLIAYCLRLRAELQARPDQLAAIEKLEQPVFLNRNGPAVALVAAGGALALATLFSGYSGVAGARPDCSPTTCKPPSRCTSDGCTNAAAPTSSAMVADMPWSAPRDAMDGRVKWLGGT